MLDLDINKVKQLPFKEIMEIVNANNGFFYNKATRLTDLLDEDGTTPHSNIRLAAANSVLDRVGISKKDQLDINMKAMHGIFILPPKDIPKND
jgi:endonuclease III-like uncharacterized protein